MHQQLITVVLVDFVITVREIESSSFSYSFVGRVITI